MLYLANPGLLIDLSAGLAAKWGVTFAREMNAEGNGMPSKHASAETVYPVIADAGANRRKGIVAG